MIWMVLTVSIIVALIVITPFVLKAILNSAISKKIDGYTGKVEHLALEAFSGKITVRSLTLNSTTPIEEYKTTLQVPVITIRFEWAQLFRKVLDLTITIEKPVLHFVSEVSERESADTPTPDNQQLIFKDALEKLMPFKLNIEVLEGEVRYVNPHTSPRWAATIREINVRIHDFSNRITLSNSCGIECDFKVCEGTGDVNFVARPLASTLTLALDFDLKSINLVLLNDLFRAYGKVDINSGTLDLHGKIVIAENVIKGHLSPTLHRLDFISRADRSDTIVQKIRERIVAAIFSILFHREKGSLSTFIPIDGRLDDPQLRDEAAILAILRRATIKALTPTVDIKSLWQKLRFKTKDVIRGFLPKPQ